MSRSADPSVHRELEQQMLDHVSHLLDDDRLRIDTTIGRRPVVSLHRTVNTADQSLDIKRIMTEMNRPDRQLQADLPQGKRVDVVVWRRKWGLFRQPVGRLHVVAVPPTRDLVRGVTPGPMDRAGVMRALEAVPPGPSGVPTTVILVSTAGVEPGAHDLADRTADRTVIIAQPNNAGGWTVVGPAVTQSLTDLFDPEPDIDKRTRVRKWVNERSVNLGSAGIAADRVAGELQLSPTWVEAELRAYARDNPGLAAKRLDGRLVLFRDGSSAAVLAAGGGSVAFIDRLRALFSRSGEVEKKVAFLAERRAALSQQRDRAYEEMSTVEARESELHDRFKQSPSDATRRRIATQLLQVRKDLDRRQQLISVLNQQLDVIGTHLHNLELIRQGETANLPNSDEITEDAARAEETLAQLQADAELAGASSTVIAGGLSSEEQAVYDELLAEAKAAEPPPLPRSEASPSSRAPSAEPARGAIPPASERPRKAEPEAG